MARFQPFAGIRYDLQRSELGRVLAPPYDVIDAAERAELAARDPHNAVRIDLPDEADGDARYDLARGQLEAWLDDGTLVVIVERSGQVAEAQGILDLVDERALGESGLDPRGASRGEQDRQDL